MFYNVLVLAMSTLFPSVVKPKNSDGTTYQFKKDGLFVGGQYHGIGQLEAVPLFIRGEFKKTISHIIILATPETLGPLTLVDNDPEKTFDKLLELYQDKLDMESPCDCLWRRIPRQMSTVEFFVRRMIHEGIQSEFEVVVINHEDSSSGLKTLLKRIRELYSEYKTACAKGKDAEWNLWLDTHGGFRDVSMAMFALVQVLAAPDEQDFAKYMEGNQKLVDAIKSMGDGLDTVPVTGVYSIEHDRASTNNTPDAIIDRTEFYRTFTEPAIRAYMNYGQFAQMLLKPDTSGPYAFISYRRNEARLERIAFLGCMKRYGYRFWYDDGIELQEKWSERLVSANKGCAVFIAIVTKTYYESEQCRIELRDAIDKHKLIILVSPDKTQIYAADKDYGEGSTKIYAYELERIVKHQQFDMKTHILDDVFQEPAVEARLKWLSDHDSAFASIRKADIHMDSDVALPSIPYTKALTHAGVFHADDVFAAALLSILSPSITITRSHTMPNDYDGLVFDVGGGEFDHHGGNVRHRPNGVPYSSFGLLWERFGTHLLCEEDAAMLDEELVQPIDLTDNTGEANPLSRSISDFNPVHEATNEEFDAAFSDAVSFARDILERRLLSLRTEREQIDHVRKLADKGDGHVLVLDQLVRWKRALVGSGYEYVVYPSNRGGYNVQCVPIRLGDGSMVRPFPHEWRGKPANELQSVTGVSDIAFCHPSGFLCAVGSMEGAVKLAKTSREWREA